MLSGILCFAAILCFVEFGGWFWYFAGLPFGVTRYGIFALLNVLCYFYLDFVCYGIFFVLLICGWL